MSDISPDTESVTSQDDRIRQRAYEIWEDEGRDGNPDDHWTRAERELSEAGQVDVDRTSESELPTDASAAPLPPERLAD